MQRFLSPAIPVVLLLFGLACASAPVSVPVDEGMRRQARSLRSDAARLAAEVGGGKRLFVPSGSGRSALGTAHSDARNDFRIAARRYALLADRLEESGSAGSEDRKLLRLAARAFLRWEGLLRGRCGELSAGTCEVLFRHREEVLALDARLGGR